MEKKQNQLQESVTEMLSKIEVEKLRPLQKNMYLRMSECYNSKSASSSEIENCVNRHAQPAQVVQQVMQHEMGQLQDRLQRCSMACQDEVRDRYPSMNGPNAAADAMAEKCLISCADKHIAMLKSIKYNIETKIDEVSKR